jgi:hypothetical protein
MAHGWNAGREAGDQSGAREGAEHGAEDAVKPSATVAEACFYVVHEQGDILLGTVRSAP